jgi:hypothetical protein
MEMGTMSRHFFLIHLTAHGIDPSDLQPRQQADEDT